MGREQRRKQDRNYKHKIDENKIETSFTLGTLIKIMVVCAVILLVFYFVLAVFVTKEVNLSSNEKDNSTSDNSNSSNNNESNNKILASKIFEQQEDSYYVYFYDFNNEDEKLQSSISNLSDGTVYRVNTRDGLNSNYVTDEKSGNIKATSLNDLKVINPTLIKIDNDKINSYYEGVSNILNFINK